MKQLLALVLLASPFRASDRILDYVNHPENLQKTMEKNALESIGEMRMLELIQGILNQAGLGVSYSVVRKIQGYDVHEVKHENGTSAWISPFAGEYPFPSETPRSPGFQRVGKNPIRRFLPAFLRASGQGLNDRSFQPGSDRSPGCHRGCAGKEIPFPLFQVQSQDPAIARNLPGRKALHW